MQRHNLLASNLAHLDTPGYQTVDLVREKFEGELSVAHVQMEATNDNHLHGASHTDQGFRVQTDPKVGEGADGNGVDLDKETMKIASNQLRYDMIAQLASSELSSLSWAANDGKNG